ncbi:hypothetical protein NYP18_08995 [Corynebacterium sp. YIM 101645]|uniref:Uncharacterized protein n=1 Tax=Corynebacterium lemuris TaxID=1859292 RepID=A0ABT2FYD2_9CORY|nr:hypothetical protein [Corynebacterium lemuris]MCS5479795.1 hypothetical protein [Corynebacterium lemuris]
MTNNLRSDRCGVCGGPPADCPCPEYWASVEVWWLGKFVGRKIWTRPNRGPSNTIPRWVTLLDIWQEKDSYGYAWIVAHIDWRGQTERAVFLNTNVVILELTAEESPHIQVHDLGQGYRSTSYDPWDGTPAPILEQRDPPPRDTPTIPAPEDPTTVETTVDPQFALFDL